MVCGRIVCAAVLLRECEVVVPRVTLFTEAESVPTMVAPWLAVLVDIGACTSPADVTDVACCMDMPAALEKNGAPVCNRGISCAPVVATCCGVITGIENDSGRGDV